MASSILPASSSSPPVQLNEEPSKTTPTNSLISSIFQAAILTGLGGCVETLFTANPLIHSESPYTNFCQIGAITAFGLYLLGFHRNKTKQEEPEIETASEIEIKPEPIVPITPPATVTVINNDPIHGKPVGLVNFGGNDCCFISALQVLLNTSSWIPTLTKIPEVNFLVDLYRATSDHNPNQTLELNLTEIRKTVPIPERNHFTEQEDPAAYIRQFGDLGGKQLAMKASYFTKEDQEIPRGELPLDDSIIRLSIDSTAPKLNLKELLKDYFSFSCEGCFDKATDKLVEKTGEKTLIKKSLMGTPPEDLLIQIKRFGVKKQTKFEGFKIKDAIEVPLTLKMEEEWIDKEWIKDQPLQAVTLPPPNWREVFLSKFFWFFSFFLFFFKFSIPEIKQPPMKLIKDVEYQCQSFLCHIGNQIKSGHYVAYVLKNEQWYKCNDSIVTPISENEAKEAIKQSYILSYKRLSQ